MKYFKKDKNMEYTFLKATKIMKYLKTFKICGNYSYTLILGLLLKKEI